MKRRAGGSIPRPPPAGAGNPFPGIEPCVLSDRRVGTERFLRRPPRRAAAPPEGGGADLGRLFGAARMSATPLPEPSRCRVRVGRPAPKRLTKTQRQTPLAGVGHGVVFFGQVVEDKRRFGGNRRSSPAAAAVRAGPAPPAA